MCVFSRCSTHPSAPQDILTHPWFTKGLNPAALNFNNTIIEVGGVGHTALNIELQDGKEGSSGVGVGGGGSVSERMGWLCASLRTQASLACCRLCSEAWQARLPTEAPPAAPPLGCASALVAGEPGQPASSRGVGRSAADCAAGGEGGGAGCIGAARAP